MLIYRLVLCFSWKILDIYLGRSGKYPLCENSIIAIWALLKWAEMVNLVWKYALSNHSVKQKLRNSGKNGFGKRQVCMLNGSDGI